VALQLLRFSRAWDARMQSLRRSRLLGVLAAATFTPSCSAPLEPPRAAVTDSHGAAAPARVTELALGAYHSCALLESGQVACWGDNSLGQLGSATAEASSVPMLVEGVSDAVEIDAGYATTCARRRGGRVACWGANAHGEADPRTDPALSSPPPPAGAHDSSGEPPAFAPGNVRRWPTELASLPPASALALGNLHACILDAESRAVCWGDGSRGQLGPARSDAFQLAVIEGPPPLVQIAAAGQYTCGRTAAGDVWCWGENTHEQLGSPKAGPEPRPVPGVQSAGALRVTADRACAQLDSGRWSCWGDGGGCADTESRLPPAHAPELDGEIDLARASGGCFWCSVASDHTLECGAGPGGTGELRLSGVARVTAGNAHACAILLDGTVQCWGANVRGELGRSSSQTRDDAPAPVTWQAATKRQQ
jgi:hypothetical protein